MANQLETVIKKTQAVYKQAAEELAKKLADFQSKFAAKDKEKRALLAAGEITKQDYQNWLAGQVFQGKQWEAKAKEAAETMVHADAEAAAIVNDGCMTAYAAAMNYGTYELEKMTGLSTGFTLYNRETVSRLLAKDPQLLPYWKIDQPKDYVWNYEKVKSTILQGIIQGKPIPEITKDLASKLQTNNTNRMRLFARTEMTGAHNAGRIDALHRAADLGIKVQKKWIATNDNRTRDAHADLDGQIREIDEPFDSELGPIDYPGDPTADQANVYNCRCAMVYIYPELEDAPEGTEEEPEYEQMDYDQWVEAQENQEAVQGETDPETVTAEDAREPEPEIMEAAEELEQTEPEPEEDHLAGLSEETSYIDNIYDSIKGTDRDFGIEQKVDNDIKTVADSLGISPEKAEKSLTDGERKLIENNDFGMQMTSDNLMKALDDGVIKNQHETGTSRGLVDVEYRKEKEAALFNVPIENADGFTDADRPVYGILMPAYDNTERCFDYYTIGPASKYGDGITVVFDKEKIIDSTTLTIGDSLATDGQQVGVAANNPMFSGGTERANNIIAEIGMTDSAKEAQEKFYELTDTHATSYMEIQLHGKETHAIENIKTVYIDGDSIQGERLQELTKKLDEKDVPYRVIKWEDTTDKRE